MPLFDDPASMIPPSRPEPPPDHLAGRRLQWRNADDQFGVVRDRPHLLDLLAAIGSDRPWQWLRVAAGSEEPKRFVQLCGSSATGLIVEINSGDTTVLIAPHDAADRPRSEIGTHGWSYLAHPSELLKLDDAVSVATDWLAFGRLDLPRWETHSTTDRRARRVDADG